MKIVCGHCLNCKAAPAGARTPPSVLVTTLSLSPSLMALPFFQLPLIEGATCRLRVPSHDEVFVSVYGQNRPLASMRSFAVGNIALGCLCSDPIIGLPYSACAKETIREGGPETRVGFCRRNVAQLRQVTAKLVSIFHAQNESRLADLPIQRVPALAPVAWRRLPISSVGWRRLVGRNQ
jgi:hypothetical protein